MAFGANYFEVEPYQFGKNNPEGIQSGAFWFYYRFGFKPCDKKLYDLALNEHQKIVSTKGYRTPAEVLKQFTESNLFVHFNNDASVPLDPEELSKFITAKINSDFDGDRLKAHKWCVQKLKSEKIGHQKTPGSDKLSWFFGMCLNWPKLSAKEKQIIQKMMQVKTTSEFEYINLLAKFPLERLIIKDFWEKYPNLR